MAGRQGAFYAVGNSTLEGRVTEARAQLWDRLSLLAAGGAGELTAANAALLARLSIIAAGGAGELTAANAALLARLSLLAAGGAGELTPTRTVALDALLSTGTLRSGTTAVSTLDPDNYGYSTISTGAVANNAWGAWTEVNAAGFAAHSLYGLSVVEPSYASIWDIQVGVGAAAAEVAIAIFRGYFPATDAQSREIYLPRPVQLAANTRVAVRLRTQSAGVSRSLRCSLLLLPRPY